MSWRELSTSFLELGLDWRLRLRNRAAMDELQRGASAIERWPIGKIGDTTAKKGWATAGQNAC